MNSKFDSNRRSNVSQEEDAKDSEESDSFDMVFPPQYHSDEILKDVTIV